jgi:hypothetical protein
LDNAYNFYFLETLGKKWMYSYTKRVDNHLKSDRCLGIEKEEKSYKQHIKYSAIFESVHPAALAYNADLKFDSKFKEVDYAHYLINKSNINW